MNLAPGYNLIGDSPPKVGGEPWYFWIVKKGIQMYQLLHGVKNWKKTHVKTVLYRLQSGHWLVFEFTFPRARWSRISEIPEGYEVFEDPTYEPYDKQCLYRQAVEYNNTPYDAPEFIWFLLEKDDIKGISNKWFVCSTGAIRIKTFCQRAIGVFKSVVSKTPGGMADRMVKVEQ